MTDLITLDAAKTALGIDVSNTDDDAFLARVIAAVSVQIQRYTMRTLIEGDFTHTFEHPRGRFLVLPEFPVDAIATITGDERALVVDDYWLDNARGIVRPKRCADFAGACRITVAYTAGFDPLPGDLLDAVLALVEVRYTAHKASAAATDDDPGGPLKKETTFDVGAYEYDTSVASAAALAAANATGARAIFGQHVDVLDGYRDLSRHV